MNYTILYQNRAIQEYESAIEWYGEKSIVAAEKIESAVLKKTDQIRTSPYQYKRTYKKYHEVALKSYPYSIVYLIDEDTKTVIIASIHHHKRHQNKKYSK